MKQDLARIEQFLDALWLEKNLAENTLNAYRRDLSMMVEWLHHRGLTLATAQSDDLQALLAERLDVYKRQAPRRVAHQVHAIVSHRFFHLFNMGAQVVNAVIVIDAAIIFHFVVTMWFAMVIVKMAHSDMYVRIVASPS